MPFELNEYILLILGLLTLIVGGEILVRGAVALSLRFKISTLVVGMTVVSFGTSAPELIVSCKAALSGNSDISIGGVIGSNIANLGLVLGLTAIIFPIPVERNSIRIDWPAMIIATSLFCLLILDGNLNFYEGIIFLVLIISFTIFLISNSRKKSNDNLVESEAKQVGDVSIWKMVIFILLGCVGLAYGAQWFLEGAITIADNYAIPDRIVGITLVAFGTSIPELTTSVIAAVRKQAGLSIGNLIGSNIFNILVVLGITSLLEEIRINEMVLSWDIYWMLGISLILLPIMLIGRKISRIDGLILVAFYVTYIIFTII